MVLRATSPNSASELRFSLRFSESHERWPSRLRPTAAWRSLRGARRRGDSCNGANGFRKDTRCASLDPDGAGGRRCSIHRRSLYYSELASSTAKAVPRSIEERTATVGRPRVEGVRFAIHGLQIEFRPTEATRLAADALSIVRSWPRSSLCCSHVRTRSTSPARRAHARCRLWTMTRFRVWGSGWGVRWLLHRYLPDSIRVACRLPLFAILVAYDDTGLIRQSAKLFSRLSVSCRPTPLTMTDVSSRRVSRPRPVLGLTGATRLHRLDPLGLVIPRAAPSASPCPSSNSGTPRRPC